MTPRKDPKDYLKVGRPSSYKPEYCQTLIEQAKNGKTLAEFAAAVGVAMNTVYKWSETFPEFMTALKESEPLREAWWINLGKGMMTGQIEKSSATMFIWMTKNILKWRDRSDVEVSGKDSSPIRVTMSDEELERRYLELIQKSQTNA